MDTEFLQAVIDSQSLNLYLSDHYIKNHKLFATKEPATKKEKRKITH